MVEHAFNQGALAVVDELLAPDGVTHLPSWGMPHTREGLKQLIAMFRSAFPDLQCTVEDEISAGDRVAAHWMMQARSHTSPQNGSLSPTWRQIAYRLPQRSPRPQAGPS